MKKRILTFLTASILVLSIAGVGSTSAAQTAPTQSELPTLY
jgi:hypothetical protein